MAAAGGIGQAAESSRLTPQMAKILGKVTGPPTTARTEEREAEQPHEHAINLKLCVDNEIAAPAASSRPYRRPPDSR